MMSIRQVHVADYFETRGGRIRTLRAGSLMLVLFLMTAGTASAQGWYYPVNCFSCPYQGYSSNDGYGIEGGNYVYSKSRENKWYTTNLYHMCIDYQGDGDHFAFDWHDMSEHLDAKATYLTSFPVDYFDRDLCDDWWNHCEAELGILPCDMLSETTYYYFQKWENVDMCGGYWELAMQRCQMFPLECNTWPYGSFFVMDDFNPYGQPPSEPTCWEATSEQQMREDPDSGDRNASTQMGQSRPRDRHMGSNVSFELAERAGTQNQDVRALRLASPSAGRQPQRSARPLNAYSSSSESPEDKVILLETAGIRVRVKEEPNGNVQLGRANLSNLKSREDISRFASSNAQHLKWLAETHPDTRVPFVITFRTPLSSLQVARIVNLLNQEVQYQITGVDGAGSSVTIGGSGTSINVEEKARLLAASGVGGTAVGVMNVSGVARADSPGLATAISDPLVSAVDVMNGASLAAYYARETNVDSRSVTVRDGKLYLGLYRTLEKLEEAK